MVVRILNLRTVNANLCGWGKILLLFWFSLNNSETVKAVTLVFWSIQQLFNRDIRTKFGIPNWFRSSDIGQNSDEGISDFRIFRQALINENCHNSRTSNDIDMKIGAITKIDKENTVTLKILTMTSFGKLWRHLYFSDFWPTWAIQSRILDAWFVKLTFSLIVTFYLTKTDSRTKKLLI